jgi:hypothetical protein
VKKATLFTIALILPLLLAACGGASAAPKGDAPAAAQPAGGALNEDYEDALPVAAQLILGSLKLERRSRHHRWRGERTPTALAGLSKLEQQ